MMVKTPVLLVMTLVFALLLCGVVSAGTPLHENQTGTVSGGLYVNTSNPWDTTGGVTFEKTQNNTLPAHTSIDSAKVYVNVYSGSGQNNWPVRTTTKFDGNGDGIYETTLGVEDMNIPGTIDGNVYWLNDHCNRVYSDYQVWYDVTNLITSAHPSIYVKTENMGGAGYDGRIKMIALVAAYNDGDNDKVHYWVLNGQDWINSGSATSTFNTNSVKGQVTSATLNTAAMSSNDGSYSFNGNAKTGNLTENGPFYQEHSWDVTNNITPGQDSNLTYTLGAGTFKINLATLTIREKAATPPVANFTADKTSGKAPLTVQFTDNSTETVTGWNWDFNNDGIADSTQQNPTYTYNNAGTYTVKLTATGPGGSATEIKTNYIRAILNNYVSYFGSSSDDTGQAITVDNDGNIYITGYTSSEDFSTTNGAYQTSRAGGSDAFLSKFNSTGTLLYSTYLGGSGADYGQGIAVDANGNIYITGRTNSANFPTTTGAYQSTNGGGYDAYLSKFNNIGELVYSTYLGGTGTDYGNGIALDSNGNAYIVGYSGSTNLPTTGDAYQTNKSTSNDAFMSKFNSSGELIYSTFLGGTGQDYGKAIALDNDGNIYITGYSGSTNFPTTNGAYQTSNAGGNDVFISKFNNAGILTYSTYFGGNDTDNGNAIAIDNSGNAYIGGQTKSNNLPITTGAYQTSNAGVNYDAFVTKLNSNGNSLVYSTYLGGSASNSIERITGIAVDEEGNEYVTGYTNSGDFPVTHEAFQNINKGGFDGDLFLTKLKTDGTGLIYSTFIGGSGNDDGNAIAIDNSGNAYITGYTNSDDFPVTPGACQSNLTNSYMEIFVAKLDLTPPVADFTADVLSDYGPLTVHFTDQSISTTNLTAWAWDFNNDSIIDSAEQNPTFTYTTPGVYTVKLTVSNVGGSDNDVKTDYITATTPPNDTEAPTVTVTPVSGNFTSAIQVVLSVTDNYDTNPKIYYTLNGTDPTTNSTLYTNPLTLTETTVLKFIGADKFGNVGNVHTEIYTINDTEAPTVTATPLGGTYHNITQVTLSAVDNADSNPMIHYTLDGASPTTNSTVYTNPINFSDYTTTILKFIAVDKSGNISPVQTQTYKITDIEKPTVSAGISGTTVTLTATDNADSKPKIYYTVNGSAPTTNSTLYTGPFSIPRIAVTTLKFIAVDSSGNTSPVQTETYNTTYPTDILTRYYAKGHVGVIVDNGGTAYGGGNPTYNLNIPEGAKILMAHLCLAWTWYGYNPYTVTFNGNNATLLAHYPDYNGYYGKSDGEGQDIYDITHYFNASGINTATITGGPQAQYGRVLIVVYQSDSEPFRKIWVNEGFDLLYYGPTTGYTFFDNVTTDKVNSAILTLTLPSGDNDSPGVVLNGQTLNLTGTGGSDPSYKYYNITSLQNGLNEVDVIGGGGYFSLQNAILTLTMEPVTANFNATPTTGNSPLNVQFTDNSTGATGWSWDFNNDGVIDSLLQNPSWTYTNPGYYTVKLNITGPAGSDEQTKTDYIYVNGPDLVVTNITPNSGAGNTLYSNGSNVFSVTVKNQGTSASPASTLKVTIEGKDYTVNVPTLGVGENATVTVTDNTNRNTGDNVPVNTTSDPGNAIPETNDSNNTLSTSLTVYNNGYRGKRYTNGNDINTNTVWNGNYDVIYSSGNSAYRGSGAAAWNNTYIVNWTGTDLKVPSGAGVVMARLYQPYTWNTALGVPDWTAQFNGKTLSDLTYYSDTKGYGTSNYPSGLLVYDVTNFFQKTGNTLSLTKGANTTTALYGSYMVVVYADSATSYKRIYINDGVDLLCSNSAYGVNSDSEATAYANYNLDTTQMSSAQLVGILASANEANKSKFFFNGQEYTGFWNGYNGTTQTGFSPYNITNAVLNGFNTAAMQSFDPAPDNASIFGDNMVALGTILILTTDQNPPSVNADIHGGLSQTTQTVTLTATDNQDTQPKIYYTTNGDDPTTVSTLYTGPILINATTTLKFIAVDNAGNTAPIQTETYTIDQTAPTTNINIHGGLSRTTQTITLTANDNQDPHPKIYYTTDGTNPTTSSTLYTGPISINTTTTLKFISVDSAGNLGLVQSETYTIDQKAPTVNANIKGGLYNTNRTVILTATDNTDSNPKIYYTLNGATPTTSSTLYTGAINISKTTTLKFIAVDNLGNIATVKTEIYTIDTVKPVVKSMNPANNAVNVPVNKEIKVVFSKAVKAGTMWIEFKNSSGKAVPFTTNIKGNTLTIKAIGKMAEAQYKLGIHTGAITDLVGNAIALKSIKFTVGTSPKVTSSNPANNARNVARNKAIKVNFSENIKASTTYWIELVANNGSKVNIKKSIKNKTLTITPTKQLKANTTYKLILHTGSITDTAGNPLKLKTIKYITTKT